MGREPLCPVPGFARLCDHGTNKPWGVGRRVSRGCIRLYPEDIEPLYHQTSMGTPVTAVDQTAKLGCHEGELYRRGVPTRITRQPEPHRALT